MLHPLLRTLVKILVASLVAGMILNYLGITPDALMRHFGLSRDKVEELVRQGLDWALPNVALGAMVIVPVWFIVYLFRPPGRSSD
jgi:Domain of unknown function (DUF6460)